jgi:hypothetical protein
MEVICYEGLRAEACVDMMSVCVYYYRTVCVFITAVPNTKLCAWGKEDSGGHVL